MKQIVLFLALMGAVFAFPKNLKLDPLPNDGTNWAVLVAGSSGYDNYRHQSDICHAYQIFHRNGIPDSNIVVMMVDDIANNARNPHKGTIINEPDGPNVYENVPKDYIKKDVTPKNFLSILKGEEMTTGSKKTLHSGPNDRVFVYFADHGAPGILAFPTTFGIIEHVLHAKDLIATLKEMYTQNKFHELVFYTEACESGSMFNGLLDEGWRIYAQTASTPYESSWACDYSTYAKAYLNDCYSINWMNNTDNADVNKETIAEQFVAVRKATTKSTVCQYGDLSIANNTLSAFMGSKSVSVDSVAVRSVNAHHRKLSQTPVSSRDVRLSTLRHQLSEANSAAERAVIQVEIDEELTVRARADKIITNVVSAVNGVSSEVATSYVQEALHPVMSENDVCTSRSRMIQNHDC